MIEWDQGYQTVQQWHLVTDEPSLLPVATLRGGSEQAGLASYSLADDLLLAVSEFTVSLKEAVLVFDQSQWMPDHKLWESIQKVGHPSRTRMALMITRHHGKT